MFIVIVLYYKRKTNYCGQVRCYDVRRILSITNCNIRSLPNIKCMPICTIRVVYHLSQFLSAYCYLHRLHCYGLSIPETYYVAESSFCRTTSRSCYYAALAVIMQPSPPLCSSRCLLCRALIITRGLIYTK